MPVFYNEAIFLGNYADADSNENSVALENRSIYEQTFGSQNDKLVNHRVEIGMNDTGGGNGIINTNNVTGPAEEITYDLGNGTVTTVIDSISIVDLTVTYADGTTAELTRAVMFQDAEGNLFLANSTWAGANSALNTAANASPIVSINVSRVRPAYQSNGLIHGQLEDFQPCFADGTLILTPEGYRPVEDLAPGDLVETLDHGPQPIRWKGGRKFDAADLVLAPKLRPIRVRPGALGPNLPEQPLFLSRQHRVLANSNTARRVVGQDALIPVAKLTGFPGIEVAADCGGVTYYHLLFDAHEVILANGAPCESLLPGPQALDALGDEGREELRAIFPELFDDGGGYAPARVLVERRRDIDQLVARHLKNGKLPVEMVAR